MAKKLGSDYRLWIESATPGTYNMIKGNVSLSYAASGSTIDTTSKDDYPFSTRAAGQRDLSIDFEIVPDLPDATGYTRFETQANLTAPTPTNFAIRKGGASGADPADVVVKGSFYITDLSVTLNNNEPVKVTGKLIAASAPTTFTLA